MIVKDKNEGEKYFSTFKEFDTKENNNNNKHILLICTIFGILFIIAIFIIIIIFIRYKKKAKILESKYNLFLSKNGLMILIKVQKKKLF